MLLSFPHMDPKKDPKAIAPIKPLEGSFIIHEETKDSVYQLSTLESQVMQINYNMRVELSLLKGFIDENKVKTQKSTTKNKEKNTNHVITKSPYKGYGDPRKS